MVKTNKLEEQLNELFVKNVPKLPDGGRKALVAWAPIVTLILGLLSLFTAWSLWHWARLADMVNNVVNGIAGNSNLCNGYYYPGYACGATLYSRFSVWLWLGVAFLAVNGILYLLAYPGLKSRQKQGWDYLYYALLLQVIYAVLSLFIPYNAGGHFIGSLIGAVIGFYLLFQIRGSYLGKQDRQTPTPTDHKDS